MQGQPPSTVCRDREFDEIVRRLLDDGVSQFVLDRRVKAAVASPDVAGSLGEWDNTPPALFLDACERAEDVRKERDAGVDRRVTKGRVLVVDDDPDFQEVIAEVLINNGFEPVPAFCGIEAIEMLGADPDIDVMMLDVMMPDMDGYEVCRKIKQSGSTALPIIFVSAKAQEPDIQRAREVGGDDYIVKPFDMDRLIGALSRVLDHTSD